MTIRAYTNLTRAELCNRGFARVSETYLSIPSPRNPTRCVKWDAKQGRFFLEFELGGQDAVSQENGYMLETIEVAFYTVMPFRRAQRKGEYQHRSARCQYEVADSNLVAKSLDDMLELYQLMREGRIYPAVLYDGKQVESLPKEFRQLWREFWALVRRQMAE